MPLSDDILPSIDAIASHIGKTKRATYHLIYKNQIPHFRIGAKIHARKSELDAALRSSVATN